MRGGLQEKEKQGFDNQVSRSLIFLDLFLDLKESKQASCHVFFSLGKTETEKEFHMAQRC